MKLPYTFLTNPNALEGIKFLAEAPVNGGVRYKIKNIIKGIDAGLIKWEEEKKAFIEKYLLKDEKGNPLPKIIQEEGKPDRQEMQVIEGKEKEAEEYIAAMNNGFYEFEADKLHYAELNNVVMSAKIENILEPLFHN